MGAIHRRMVEQRLTFMGGRISEFAADRSLRSTECRLVAYVGTLVLLAPIVLLAVSCQGVWAGLFVGLVVVLSVTMNVLAYRFGRQANLDIVRRQGLPDSAWRHVRANSPDRFDSWLRVATAGSAEEK